MLRQFNGRGALIPALIVAAATGVAACGIKGPLQPAPRATATPPPIDNPATPPATTAPALPPPQSERKP